MPMINTYSDSLKNILPNGVYLQSQKKSTPSQRVLDNIFNYSKSLVVKKSKDIGLIETILN